MENSDTYGVAVEQLRGSAEHGIGAVVWGSGKTFPAQVPSLEVDVAGQGPLCGIAWYWGDYDPIGTATAVAAARAAGGIEVLPGHGTVGGDGPVPRAGSGHPRLVRGGRRGVVKAGGMGQLSYVRAAGGRIAQELVPAEAVAAWVAGLSAGPRG